MKHLKIFALAAIAAMALTASISSSASASTWTITGVTQVGAVTVTATLVGGTSTLLQTTSGAFIDTCTASDLHWTSVSFTGEKVSGPVSSWSASSCTSEKVVVDKAGSLSFERIGATRNATMRSSGAEFTAPSPFGAVTCKTGEGTDVGTLTGVTSGSAKMDINAVLNCGFLVPSATWVGEWVVTTPHASGVTG